MHWWQLALLGDEARLCSWEGGLDVINLWGNEGVIGGERRFAAHYVHTRESIQSAGYLLDT